MPSWPIAIPSSTAIVLNSFATPPARSISRATNWPISFKCTCPGTNWVNEFETAIIGLLKSSSVIPVARHKARAPAILRPAVVVFERYTGMVNLQTNVFVMHINFIFVHVDLTNFTRNFASVLRLEFIAVSYFSLLKVKLRHENA